MAMPIDLLLVRHGESVGNLANRRSRAGDNSDFTDEFRSQNSAWWPLTDEGIHQARLAGQWIRDNLPGISFDRRYVSPYTRAFQTGAELKVPGNKWYISRALREREIGDMEVMTHDERLERFEHSLSRQASAPYYWRPPNGESLADVEQRLHPVLNTLYREAETAALLVCHGEVMLTMSVLLEHTSDARIHEIVKSKESKDHIFNCHIMHYTRREEGTGPLTEHDEYVRSLCGYDPSLHDSGWQKIQRTSYTDDDLQKAALLASQQ